MTTAQSQTALHFPGLLPGDGIQIWYMKPVHFREMSWAAYQDKAMEGFDPSNLSATHTMVGTIDGTHHCTVRGSRGPREFLLSRVFEAMQGERWSPTGEARELIQTLGLMHTSMSAGDIIRFNDNETYLVGARGFVRV